MSSEAVQTDVVMPAVPSVPPEPVIRVRKRNGTLEPTDINKIIKAVRRCCDGLPDVDPMRVASKTINGVFDGTSSRDLDLLSIQTAASLTVEDPQYAKLAARLLSEYMSKEVRGQGIQTFSQSVSMAASLDMANDRLQSFVRANSRKLDDAIRTHRDDNFDYFGLQTVYDRYLLRHPKTRFVIETPQQFFMRIACALSETVSEAIELYTSFSSFEYVPSSPTLFNAGTRHEQLSSCFLLDSPKDDLDSIYAKYTDVARLSKFSGGIGISYSRIRSRGSHIKGTNGRSNGIVPWLKTLDASVAAVSQGSKRKGACCVYLETWHPDIMEFLELRDNTGDEARRTHNLNIANWIPDLFMERVNDDKDWSLFDPKAVPALTDLYGDDFRAAYEAAEKAGLAAKVVKARDLYTRMVRTLAQTGNGWMCFKDKSNNACNQTAEPGRVVHLSNLCVAPETKILTRTGYVRISDIADQKVDVWNGNKFSEVTVRKTGENQPLLTVELSNGARLTCTKYHKFVMADGSRVAAEDLIIGSPIMKADWPLIESGSRFPHAYTHGVFCGDGTYGNGRPRISLYGEKKELIDHISVRTFSGNEDSSGRLNVGLPLDLPKKFTVPTNACLEDKLSWLSGLCDTDGTVARNGDCESLQIGNTNLGFLNEVRLMLTTMGVDSKVTLMREAGLQTMPDHKGGTDEYETETMYRLLITAGSTFDLLNVGLSTHRLLLSKKKPGFDRRRFVRVVSIIDDDRIDDTYCFNEPDRNIGAFNGILTGQCTEILELSSEDETAVCNLGSINVGRHMSDVSGKLVFDYMKLAKTVRAAVRQLDRVIDINYYTIPTASASNMKWRPVGLGMMGLQDVFFQLRIPFDGPEARQISKKISEEIYYCALTASTELAEEKGAHPGFSETRAARGELQFDAWDVKPDGDRWNALKIRIKASGLRNSLLIAIAPTATIASILGCYECIEPQVSNLFKRETMSGDFIQVNKYLVNDLKELGLWNEATRSRLKLSEGSVQAMDELPSGLKLIYRTAWEMSMRSLIDMAADRGAFIDQSQSLNLFVESPNIGPLSSMYNHAWKRGLKTTYYLRSRPATKIAKATVDTSVDTSVDPTGSSESELAAVVCSLESPESCEACQ